MNTNAKEVFDGIVKKIQDMGGEEAVTAFRNSKGADLPAVKLSSDEMALLKGGSLWEFITGKPTPGHDHERDDGRDWHTKNG